MEGEYSIILFFTYQVYPICLHDLRHIHATEPLRLGEPLHVVAHRNAMVTATVYAHVSDQQIETASDTFAHAMSQS